MTGRRGKCIAPALLVLLLSAVEQCTAQGNTTTFHFTMLPHPATLSVAYGFSGFEGLANCFQFNALSVDDSSPFQRTYSSSQVQCGGVNLAVSRHNTSIVNGTVNTSSETYPSGMVEMILLDPLEFDGDDLTAMVQNMSRLRDYVGQLVTWGSGAPSSSASAWDAVRDLYYARTFNGSLRWSNLLEPKTRFLETNGVHFHSMLKPLSGVSIPMCMVVFLPVHETYVVSGTYQRGDDVSDDQRTFFFASTPWNISVGAHIVTELQVQMGPRMSFQVNYSVGVSPSSLADNAFLNGSTVEIVNSPRLNRRRMVRRDDEWSLMDPPLSLGNVAVIPSLMDVDGASWRRAVTTSPDASISPGYEIPGGLDNRSWWSSTASLKVSTLRSYNSSLFATRTVRCMGLRWRPFYANSSLLSAVFLPTPLGDGTGTRNASSGSFELDNPCFPTIASVPPTNANGSSTHAYTSIDVCPSLGTELLHGFFVCTAAATASSRSFEFAAAVDSSRAASWQDTLGSNSTNALSVFLTASNNNGVVTTNDTALLPSSMFRWENSGAGANAIRRFTALGCFSDLEMVVIPLLLSSSPNTTLRPTTSSVASLAATLSALRSGYRCGHIAVVSTLLITSVPLDGYCGFPWRVGLTADLLVSGLLLSYHNTEFRKLSTLYAATAFNISLTSAPRCCQEVLEETVIRTICTNITTVSTSTCWSYPNNVSCVNVSVPRIQKAGNLSQEYTIRKSLNQTILGRALRCSYDLYNVKRNCSAAAGAYLQLVLLPATDWGASLLENHTLLQEYIASNPSATSLTGLPLQLTNNSGIASFPSAAPLHCFGDTVRLAVVFPMKGATDGTSVISNGAVLSYYSGISSFQYDTQLYVVVRPTPFICMAGVRTTFVEGTLGVPLGPLDTDIQDTCGTLLSGLVSVRAVPGAGNVPSIASAVQVEDAPLSSTLTGILERSTIVESTDATLWRATFVGVVPVSNVTTSNTKANVRMSLRMRSRALAATGDTILTTDVNEIPFLSHLFLSSCVNPNFLWMTRPNRSADAVAPLLSGDCGFGYIPLELNSPLSSSPITIVVGMTTSPQLLDTSPFAKTGVWINLTFSLSNFNSTNIRVASNFSKMISFSSNLDRRRAPRAFMFSIEDEASLEYFAVEIREQITLDFKGHAVISAAFVLPIFVNPQPLFTNLLRESVTMRWSDGLFLNSQNGNAPSYVFSTNTLGFTIHPNGRSLLGDAVTWINFLTMSGFVVRTGTVVAMFSATAACFQDAGDRLSLVLHPLAFGIGPDETTQYLVGAVVGNTGLIAVAFIAQIIVETMLIRDRAGGAVKGGIDVEDPDATKGLETFPRWGLTAASLLYPGVLYCGVRAVSLGLNTFLLYTVMLLLVIVGVGYPAILIVAMKYYSPRWQENEAFNQKDVTTVSAVSTAAQASRSSGKGMSSLYKNRLLSAKNAVADTQQKVQGLFSKIFTPTGFYEVNHTDHVRFLVAYQEYRGSGPLGSSLDAVLALTFAIASAFDCPDNQLVAMIGMVLHLLFLFAYRPYITVGRVLCNVLVDIGCLIGVAITYRGREREGTLTLQSTMLFMSGLNIFGMFWAVWRSVGLRRWVRSKRKLSKKADRFYGRGEHYSSTLTKLLIELEDHLFRLHSVKPEVVYRRNLRKRKLLLNTGHEMDLVVETASDTGSDDSSSGKASSYQGHGGSTVGSLSNALAAAPSPSRFAVEMQPVVMRRELSTGAMSPPESPAMPESILKNDKLPSLSSSGVSFAAERQKSSSPLKRVTSVAIPSGVSDEDSSDEEAKLRNNTIHRDAPDAMNDKSAARRRFAQNRFKPYLKTVDGRPFGRSDEQSVVKRLVIGPDGVREVREWREGTHQMANEELRKRKALEEEFMNISSSSLRTKASKATSASSQQQAEDNQRRSEGHLKQWEEAFRHEITRRAGATDVQNGASFRESMLHRRQRALGDAAPKSFDFERGAEMDTLQTDVRL